MKSLLPLLDILIPVKNEADTIGELAKRVHRTLTDADISYRMIFIDDRSTDKTVETILSLPESYAVVLHKKQGKPGKAFSILEGAKRSRAQYLVMLDADLQYAPEIIPEMLKLTKTYGVVIANRKVYKSTRLRRIASRANAFVFGKLLFGLGYDVQSGLKLFDREIIDHIDVSNVGKWSLDIPLLFTAKELGYTIGSIDISFEPRSGGESKIRFLHTAGEIAINAFRLKRAKRRIYYLAPTFHGTMAGAGIAYRQKRFITHTTLSHNESALLTFTSWQLFFIGIMLGIVTGGMIFRPWTTAVTLVAFLSAIYFLDVLFSIYLTLKSLHFPPEIDISDDELGAINEKNLPMYTILCPLYREAHVIPQFLENLAALDWPKQKLEVLLLLEEDDHESIDAVRAMVLPSYVRSLVVPHSLPKTKPKACNFGLAHAKGEYIVIYDAEDKPDTDQLKIAYQAFQKSDSKVFCLQAKLNYYNPHHNLLTRFFTAEYSLWFDVTLPGLQSIGTAIPLGGTSNHFRTKDLLSLKGWDPFNVTEDCDLGIRLFRAGYKTAIINSTTLEEANSNVKNWLRQRSRWIKGYLQTYFVHMRNPISLTWRHGVHAVLFQLIVGGKIAFMLINPLLWVATISYFALYAYVGPTIEALYPSVIFYMAAFSLVFGNFLYLYNYMIGSARREHWSIIKYVFLVPFYWLMVSAAAVIAVIELIVRPHYWQKTNHGLHLKKITAQTVHVKKETDSTKNTNFLWLGRLINSGVTKGGLLVVASGVGSVLNFLYNAYLGRNVSIEMFGLINLFGAFFYLVNIPIGALGRTITHRSAYLLGKYGSPVPAYWKHLMRPLFLFAVGATILWLAASPFIAQFFHMQSLAPVLLFSPIWLTGIGVALNMGFLGGSLQFSQLAALTILDAIVKLVVTVLLVTLGLSDYVYAVMPLSLAFTYIVGFFVIARNFPHETNSDHLVVNYFPRRFFATSVLSILATAAFLTVDVLMVNHFLSAEDAGHYGLLSLVGKMIFIVGSMFGQFINPVVSREVGAGRDGRRQFYMLLGITTLICMCGVIVVGLFGFVTIPILFGKNALPVIEQLPLYTLAMACFTIAGSVVSYHQIRKDYLFPVVSFLLAAVQVTGIILWHDNLGHIVFVMFGSGILHLAVVMLMHMFHAQLQVLLQNTSDFTDLFGHLPASAPVSQKLRILIFNWRDTKHAWAGGAEVYVHETAKHWVSMGHSVTVFCGKYGKTPRNQVIDGVQIVRRGGFFTVYIWAFLYYMFRFRGLFDVVVDSENGIPFFTPLYVRVPTFLLIYHVHQVIFRERLMFPFSTIASFAESTCMPLVYKSSQVITISNSSKHDIITLKLAKPENVTIIHAGIDVTTFGQAPKTVHPSFLYLGRLQRYKNIDVAIRAFAQIHEKYPQASLAVAGEGEHKVALQKLAQELRIAQAVSFLGRVSEYEKHELFAKSWAAIQPSSYEGWGISVIEANASGTPVIASNVHGLRDSVVGEKTGILVPVRNVNAIALAMEKMIEDPGYRKRLNKQAYEWSKLFNWQSSAEEFEVLIKKHLYKKQLVTNKNKYVLSHA